MAERKKKVEKKKKIKKTTARSVLQKTKISTRTRKKVIKRKRGVLLKRALHNPIIEPREYPWESKATFNPAAFTDGEKVHLIYRAIGDNDSSVLGYAGSRDGYKIDDRPTYFIYRRENNFSRGEGVSPIDYISGGGWNGGCEDPRLTLIDDKVYMLYTAFDGWGSLRVALTSIKLEDFKNKNWKWKNPVLISPPGEMHKNWVLFPEKIDGKFAILHSISPAILVDYFDSLGELDGKMFIHSAHNNNAVWASKEKSVRGVGPAPIKTKYGWLVFYHAIEKKDPNRYKLFAMILDIKDPRRVFYDSAQPVLEPDSWYENEGYKSGVVYACGAVVRPAHSNGEDKTLFVYYGGADRVVGVATIPLSELLEDLKKHKAVKLKKQTVAA